MEKKFKVLILNGSPRENGNIALALNEMKQVFDEANVESIIAGNTSKSPQNTSFTNAITNAMMKNATQIQFNTILFAKVAQIAHNTK